MYRRKIDDDSVGHIVFSNQAVKGGLHLPYCVGRQLRYHFVLYAVQRDERNVTVCLNLRLQPHHTREGRLPEYSSWVTANQVDMEVSDVFRSDKNNL